VTSALGSVTVHENEVINLPSFALTTAVDSVTVVAKANITPIGVSSTFAVGPILVWGEIDTDQTPSYNEINDGQTPSYSAVSTSQTPNYTEIDAGRSVA